MALSFKAGSFTSRTSTGTDVIAGVGFQPKVIMLYTTEPGTIATYTDAFDFRFGAAINTTAADQGAFDSSSWENGTTSYAEESWNGAGVYTSIVDAQTSVKNAAVISAIGADGFTVNWTVNDAIAKTIFYICIGGSDITNTFASEITGPAAGGTGNQVISGVGFQPDFVMLWGVGETGSTKNYGLQYCMGFATSAAQQVCFGGSEIDDLGTSDNCRYQRADKIYALISKSSTSTKALEGALVSMNADGFTINWTTVTGAGANRKIGYIALKGGSYFVGSINSPIAGTAPVSQAVTGVGFQPTGILLASVGGVANTAIQNSMRLSFGGGSSSASRFLGWSGCQDAAANTVNAKIMLNNKIVKVATENTVAASTTTQAEADITSLDTDGYTLSWTTKDAVSAYQILYVAFGSTWVGGGGVGAKDFLLSKAWFSSDM